MSSTQIGYDGHVAIVTGAGSGIGRAHALMLAERGCRVVVNDLGPDTGSAPVQPGEVVVAEIQGLGGEAVYVNASVATEEGGAAIVQAALDTYGTLDIVVNNAGIIRDKKFENMTMAQVNAVIDTHLRGAFNVTLPAWQIMAEKGFGRVIFTSSASGLLGSFGQANYSAAKMGLVGLTKTLAAEGAKLGITVNAIAPVARTPMTEGVFTSMKVEQGLDPAEIAAVAVYLTSPTCTQSGYVIGCGGGVVNAFHVGVTQGCTPMEGTGQLLTPEAVRDCFVRATSFGSEFGALVFPGSMGDEVNRMKLQWAAAN
jgi:NAD(P)-dependent dehydrogenase (short-subunit alcohol dehydrogenase family)